MYTHAVKAQTIPIQICDENLPKYIHLHNMVPLIKYAF